MASTDEVQGTDTLSVVPEPMIFRMVGIPLKHGDDPQIHVAYTDCVESSFLRMLHLVLSSAAPTDVRPSFVPIDLVYLRSVCDNPDLIAFFERHKEIVYSSEYYDAGNPGFTTRAEWCDFVTRKKDIFKYVRTGLNVFIDNMVTSGQTDFTGVDFCFELDATFGNIVSLFSSAFPGIREKLPPIADIVEDTDDTAAYKPYLDVIADFFTRPERNFNLSFKVSRRYSYALPAFTFTQFFVNVFVNGQLVWKWATQRRCFKEVWLGAHSEINVP